MALTLHYLVHGGRCHRCALSEAVVVTRKPHRGGEVPCGGWPTAATVEGNLWCRCLWWGRRRVCSLLRGLCGMRMRLLCCLWLRWGGLLGCSRHFCEVR